jgi:hypothetical protein
MTKNCFYVILLVHFHADYTFTEIKFNKIIQNYLSKNKTIDCLELNSIIIRLLYLSQPKDISSNKLKFSITDLFIEDLLSYKVQALEYTCELLKSLMVFPGISIHAKLIFDYLMQGKLTG